MHSLTIHFSILVFAFSVVHCIERRGREDFELGKFGPILREDGGCTHSLTVHFTICVLCVNLNTFNAQDIIHYLPELSLTS